MLGTDLTRTAPRDAVLASPLPHEVDITDGRRVAAVLDDLGPDWVINAAAYTAVDQAETDRATANAVNGEAPRLLGVECGRRGIKIVHYGTDYVFPGTATTPYEEGSPVEPVNAYGRSKLLGERGLLESGAHALVLRTQWLFGVAGRSFPRTMWERARAGKLTRVVSDQTGRPTYTVDLAAATWRLMTRGSRGILHVTNAGPPATWYDLATPVFTAAGAPSLLQPCSTSDYPAAARRPTYSVLSTDLLDATLAGSLPNWNDALQRFLAELSAEATNTTVAVARTD